jgi:signal transduction histidine kinase
VLLPLSRVVDHALYEHPTVSVELAGSALARWTGDASFLLALSALVATLAVFPDGRYERRYERRVVRVAIGLAVAASLVRLLAAPTIAGGGDPTDAAANALAVPGLEPLGVVATGIVRVEPLWVVAAVTLLVLRFRRADAARRDELRYPLVALAGFGLVLVATIAAHAAYAARGAELTSPLVGALFLVALASFPVSLLLSLSLRIRHLRSEVTSSRERLVQAEHEARRRIERDLHDGVQQQLVGLLSLLQVATRQAGRDERAASLATLELATDQAQRTVTDLRDVVSGIHPAVLSDRGFVAALADHLATPGVPVRITAPPDLDRSPFHVEAAAFYVTCEAVTNAMKHADASEVVVEVRQDDRWLHVDIEDDGGGFDPATTTPRGLLGARDRVESVGGTLEVHAAPGRGTRLAVSLPRARP